MENHIKPLIDTLFDLTIQGDILWMEADGDPLCYFARVDKYELELSFKLPMFRSLGGVFLSYGGLSLCTDSYVLKPLLRAAANNARVGLRSRKEKQAAELLSLLAKKES